MAGGDIASSCLAFSSRVMGETRSAARCSGVSAVLRSAVALLRIGLRQRRSPTG